MADSQSKGDTITSVKMKVSPQIKREPRSPPLRPRRRRLRSPVFLDEGQLDRNPKSSRLSSPVVISGSNTQNPSHFGGRDHVNHESSPRDRGSMTRSHRHQDSFQRSNGRSMEWGKRVENAKSTSNKPKEQPNFELSGKLAADTNTYKGVVIKYNEPEDARKPSAFWRLYPFKGNEALKVMHIHRQSGYLIGSSPHIADLPMAHPSISKQHAVLQFRFTKGDVRLYVIDLESTNGTFLNNKRIEPRRYYELREKDVLKFGYSTREYVVMTDRVGTDSDIDK